MSFDELESAALKMPSIFREALAERLLSSLRASTEGEAEPSPSVRVSTSEESPGKLESSMKGATIQALFATWDKEDATEDREELAARRRELRRFQEALNANRPSERPLST